jgi:hypothetical protein
MEEIMSINGKWNRKEGIYHLSASEMRKTIKLKYKWLRKLQSYRRRYSEG